MILSRFWGHDIDFDKAATMWTVHHLIYFLFALLAIFGTLTYAKRIRESSKEQLFKIILFSILVILEIVYHVHNWTYPRFSLPLHVCSFAVFMNLTLLLTNSKKVFNYAFFYGVLGGFMALAIPNSWGYTYLNFRYYHFLILHFTIITVPMYYYKAYGFRVSYKTTIRVFRDSVILGITIFVINGFIGQNYWFIRSIPDNVSSAFTNWNIYIVTFVALVFTSMNTLYLLSNLPTLLSKHKED